MPNYAINQLTSKTPASTDIVPVADPTTGIAGKSTTVDIVNASSSTAITATYTGSIITPIYGWVEKSFGNQNSDGTIDSQAGVFASFVSIPNNNYSLTGISFDNLIGIRNFFYSNLPFLQSFSFPVMRYCGGLNISSENNVITSISAPALKVINGTVNLNMSNQSQIASINLPALEKVNGTITLNWGVSGVLTNISMPNLTHVDGSFTIYAGNATYSLGSLISVGSALSFITAGGTCNLPSLQYIGGKISLQTWSSAGGVTFNAIKMIAPGMTSGNNAIELNSGGTASVNTFVLGSGLLRVGGSGGNVVMSSCSLSQTYVDQLLVRLANLNGTGGTTTFSNRIVTITGTSSAPSATGLSAKSTLVSRGCTVTHN